MAKRSNKPKQEKEKIYKVKGQPKKSTPRVSTTRAPRTTSGKVQGKVSDYLNMNDKALNTLTKDELAGIITKMANVYNRRLPRLAKEGSRAYTNVMEGGGKFSSKGKTLNELRKEYARINSFADDLSATVEGTKKIRKEFLDRVGLKGSIDAGEYNELWGIYNKLQSELGSPFNELGKFIKEFGSNQIQKTITEWVKDFGGVLDTDEIVEKLKEKYNNLYDEKMTAIREEEAKEWQPLV